MGCVEQHAAEQQRAAAASEAGGRYESMHALSPEHPPFLLLTVLGMQWLQVRPQPVVLTPSLLRRLAAHAPTSSL
jgi:hypothetical protein